MFVCIGYLYMNTTLISEMREKIVFGTANKIYNVLKSIDHEVVYKYVETSLILQYFSLKRGILIGRIHFY
ncbi:uncharacterized protein BX663DRAFT_493872 [Cokeromyces recurvatus]|uniref:uncharacterized protein n=1 Tax=Cokeromyces recurvatus TaxID=90255 RepID=UPI00222033F6|nr:uncharacterized protein BX663DRAFT_493872 [Cokeromyces recurvatus]KAI7908343.1 hypothetical protein BX663DRAFT_493872 [Cokeromyces recurvatus]